MLGFLIVLTFAGAYVRYEAHSQMVSKEANSINTAFLRLDLLPEESKVRLQKKFVEYIDVRMHFYDVMTDFDAAFAEFRHLEKVQGQIWDLAVKEASTIKEALINSVIPSSGAFTS